MALRRNYAGAYAFASAPTLTANLKSRISHLPYTGHHRFRMRPCRLGLHGPLGYLHSGGGS